MNTFVHSSAVQQALIEARKRACVRVYVGGKRLFGHLWARYSIHGGVTVARSTRRFAPSMRSRRNGRNERSREERRALSPRVNGRFLTRVCGRGAAVWASEGSAKYTRWWNRRWIHQATRSVDTVTAKRSKRALSPGVSITLVEGQQAVNDARMWAGSGSLSISGIVQWCTVVEPSLDPPGDSLRRHRNGETVETEHLRDTPAYRRFQQNFGHYGRTDSF